MRQVFGPLEYPTSPERLHDTTVRRHWERARKVDIHGNNVTIDTGQSARRRQMGYTAA